MIKWPFCRDQCRLRDASIRRCCLVRKKTGLLNLIIDARLSGDHCWHVMFASLQARDV